MNDSAIPVKFARLMTTFGLEIESLTGSLKCSECNSVLKHMCQIPVDCHLFHTGMDDIIASEARCSETSLMTTQQDENINRSNLMLTAKCPKPACSHECPLADVDGHVQVNTRKNVEYHFRELGSPRDTRIVEDMNRHLQQGSRSPNKILMRMVADNNIDIEALKQRDQASRAEIEMLKRNDEVSRGEIEMLKRELVLKNEQMKTIMDEIKYVKGEIKSTKDENKLIKKEKEISDGEKPLSAKVEQKIDSRESDELHSARITAITRAISSNCDALKTEMDPVRYEMGSINLASQAVKDNDIDSTKPQIQVATQAAVGLGQIDASCDNWLIEVDVGRASWGWKWGNPKTSCSFTGAEPRPYTFQLAAGNLVRRGELRIYLRLLAGPNDALLQWPFRGAVTVTVAHTDRREACWRLTRHCLIEQQQGNHGAYSDPFVFWHSVLKSAGLELERGVRVSCQVSLAGDQ